MELLINPLIKGWENNFFTDMFSLPGFPYGLVDELYFVYFMLLIFLLFYQGPKNVCMKF